MAKASAKALAWPLFDAIIRDSPAASVNPWQDGRFVPDYNALALLLAVPVHLGASSQSGVPALALDVWVASELRRAGLAPDGVWPRTTNPRVLPKEITTLLDGLPNKLRDQVNERLVSGKIKGLGGNANLLGRAYVKQVDVVMSAWDTGPEVMVSTKRMDSSFAKNAANRIEEAYGDAKNLRPRHPQAALGFVFSLRSTAFVEESDAAAWILDLLAKLGREDDAYDAVALIVPEWGGAPLGNDEPEEGIPEVGIDDDEPDEDVEVDVNEVEQALADLPPLTLRLDLVPPELEPGRFFEVVVGQVLKASPINMHREARKRLREGA